jgi:hypothetical protein
MFAFTLAKEYVRDVYPEFRSPEGERVAAGVMCFPSKSGRIVEKSTGCRDETAARKMLADWQRRAELVKANVITAAENRTASHQTRPLAHHFDVYGEHLQAIGVTEKHGKERRHYLDQLAADCCFTRLADLTREAFERWLAQRTGSGMSARLRNAYRESLVVGFTSSAR